ADSNIGDFLVRTRPWSRCTRVHWDAALRRGQYLAHDDAHGRDARPGRGDRARHGWCFLQESECRKICASSARGFYERPSWGARVSHSRQSFPLGTEAAWRSDMDADFCRSAPECHTPDSGRRSCSRSCGRCQTPCKVPPSPRRLAGEQQTAFFRPSPNTPSKASLPPLNQEEVLPMCPVRNVTYVSGRSFNHLRCNSHYSALPDFRDIRDN